MNQKNEAKLKNVKAMLDNKGIFYTEFANGQLSIDGIMLWATSEVFYDSKNSIKGQGINSFWNIFKIRN